MKVLLIHMKNTCFCYIIAEILLCCCIKTRQCVNYSFKINFYPYLLPLMLNHFQLLFVHSYICCLIFVRLLFVCLFVYFLDPQVTGSTIAATTSQPGNFMIRTKHIIITPKNKLPTFLYSQVIFASWWRPSHLCEVTYLCTLTSSFPKLRRSLYQAIESGESYLGVKHALKRDFVSYIWHIINACRMISPFVSVHFMYLCETRWGTASRRGSG